MADKTHNSLKYGLATFRKIPLMARIRPLILVNKILLPFIHSRLFFSLMISVVAIVCATKFAWCDALPLPHKTVAITQIVEHPSLDLVRKSFMKVLEEAGFVDGKNITVMYETAQGSVTTAVQIAKKFASHEPDVVLGISTPSAQALIPSLKEAGIPLVFAAVSDPVSAKLVPKIDQPNAFVTGATDAQPIEQQFELMMNILPELKSVGIVYNPGEINSVKILERLRIFMKDKGIHVAANGASKSSEVSSALAQLLDHVDAIYVTLDNAVVSALQAILKQTDARRVPVFSTDPDLVKNGVLASLGNGYKDVGELAGQMAVRILKGESPLTIPISAPSHHRLYLNVDVAQRLNIPLNHDLISKADFIVKNGDLIVSSVVKRKP